MALTHTLKTFWQRLLSLGRPLSHAGVPTNATRAQERELMTANIVVIFTIMWTLPDVFNFYSFGHQATTYIAIALSVATSVYLIGFALLALGYRWAGVFLFSNTVLMLLATTTQLIGCAATPSSDHNGISQLQLFDASGRARFSFYYSCAESSEMNLCWVPSKYFSLWARERHVSIAELPDDPASNAKSDALSANLAKIDSGADYRIVVRFVPFIRPSYTITTGSSGPPVLAPYEPPKVGYQADLHVYASHDGALLTQASYHSRTDAPFKADAVPYIKAGVRAVLTALDPSYDSTL